MGSCKKASVIERILLGDNTSSIKKLVSYANQMNGMVELYKAGKLKISKDYYEKRVKAAYDIIMIRLNGGGIELNYVLPQKEASKPERRGEKYRTRKH